MDQIVLDAGKIGILPAMLDEVLAHGHERAGAAGREVQPAEHFLTRRLDRLEKRLQGPRRLRLVVGGPGGAQALLVGTEIASQQSEERDALGDRQAAVKIEQLPSQRNAGGLATPRQQQSRQILDPVSGMGRTLAALPGGSPSRRAVDEMAPAFGNAAQHVLEEARAHLSTSRLV